MSGSIDYPGAYFAKLFAQSRYIGIHNALVDTRCLIVPYAAVNLNALHI